MASATRLRSELVAAKQRLAEGREKLRQRHAKGSPGIQVCRAMTELFDSIVLGLFHSAVDELAAAGVHGAEDDVVLVAHGGYGRGDIAPYSDVDLMILHEDGLLDRVAPLAQRMVRDVFDVGLVLGQSVRTCHEACDLARRDATICTSLIESRRLVGSEALFERFTTRFAQQVRRRSRPLVAAIGKSRHEERAQFGETVYLLEPNIKRSPGGLRDLQLLRWIGFTQAGVSDPDSLRLAGVLERDDYEHVRESVDFLLHLRNEMHFFAGKPNDLLDRGEQVRIAQRFGFQGTEGLLPVEQFMRRYFSLTQGVSGLVERFLASARRGPRWLELLASIFSHQFERDFRVEPRQISLNRRGRAKLSGDLAEILRLADVANLYDKPIAQPTLDAVRAAVPRLPTEISIDAAARFISLLSQPARLGEMLRKLHELGVLEKIIPAFEHARSLLQFNVYHKYTVDEHSIRAVDEATRLLGDPGPLGTVYKHLKRKWLLHLALLLHDLGKGYPQDHSEVGAEIAEATARRLHLAARDAEILKFLVHKHLLMSHLAFRRDTSDKQLVVRFAVEVGSAEALEMLFVISAADLAAVGPGVLNAWKIEVLTDLFHRAMEQLGGEDPTIDVRARLELRRDELLTQLATDDDDREWFERQLAALPATYLETTPPQQVERDLGELRGLARTEAVARGRYQPDTGTVAYQIGTYETITPGVFHKLTGALTAQGLQILSAEINTLADGLIFDRFFVADPDYAGEPPEDRLETVSAALVAALDESGAKPPVFRRVWKPASHRSQADLSPLPTQVRADNSTSENYTILDIFAADRMGLLYTITHTLFELGLSVSLAKIGTHLDQVVDVFYVTDSRGRKIEREEQLHEIRSRLLAAIAALEASEAAR